MSKKLISKSYSQGAKVVKKYKDGGLSNKKLVTSKKEKIENDKSSKTGK